MISAPNYEAAGADAALECLDAISNSTDQASACRYLLGLLNSLYGCDEVSKGARRGAATILANALERGLKAIRQDGK